jgi:hypothetical protein
MRIKTEQIGALYAVCAGSLFLIAASHGIRGGQYDRVNPTVGNGHDQGVFYLVLSLICFALAAALLSGKVRIP